MQSSNEQVLESFLKGEREYLAQQTGAHMQAMLPMLKVQLEQASALIHEWNTIQGFWESENVGEKLCLIHTEISEAMEADRHDAASDKIPTFSGVEEELADAVIRILDFSAHFKLRLAEAIVAKTHYNLSRPYKHGKKC